ncbi:hypothetical protein JL722_822 [Aureococcus anophagefferens]|nr:hypothetical protein JL722_822 [Aureococcus anophagefferens]
MDDYLASGDVDESLVASTVDAARVITGTRSRAIAFENLGVSAFNDDALQFKKAIVASVADVTSTDQVTSVRAVEARRRKLEAGALVEYTVVVTQTLRDAGADYAETYLSEFVAGVAEAADDGLFVQRSEASSADDDDDGTESASADVPMFIGIAGVVVLAVGLAALYKARKTSAVVPPVVEAETAKAPEV